LSRSDALPISYRISRNAIAVSPEAIVLARRRTSECYDALRPVPWPGCWKSLRRTPRDLAQAPGHAARHPDQGYLGVLPGRVTVKGRHRNRSFGQDYPPANITRSQGKRRRCASRPADNSAPPVPVRVNGQENQPSLIAQEKVRRPVTNPIQRPSKAQIRLSAPDDHRLPRTALDRVGGSGGLLRRAGPAHAPPPRHRLWPATDGMRARRQDRRRHVHRLAARREGARGPAFA
jgi:hypothetical protein